MMKLSPYPEYKNSGVEWLDKMPVDWEARKLRNLLTPFAERNRQDLPLLSVVREKGVIYRSELGDTDHNFIPDDLSNYKYVKAGHFAMNKMKAWQGSYGISDHDGIVSPAYYVFELRYVDKDFFHRAIRSRIYVDLFARFSDGVRIGQWDLSINGMKEIPFLVPPNDLQRQIVRFLDAKTRLINRYVRNKRRLIELLQEQKQAIINDCVTGKMEVKKIVDENGNASFRLEPYAEYKDSGVEWLGKIPVGWGVRKIKHLAEIIDGDRGKEYPGPNDLLDAGILFLSSNNIVSDKFNFGKTRFISHDKFNKLGRGKLTEGDIVITVRGTIGSVALFSNLGIKTAFINAQMMILRPKKGVLSEYIYLVATSNYWKTELLLRAYGAAQQQLSNEILSGVIVPTPPLEIQKKIVNSVNSQCAYIDNTIQKAQRQIELIREYRIRLIADVVTGKVDVRDIPVEDIPQDDAFDEPEDEPENIDESLDIDDTQEDDS